MARLTWLQATAAAGAEMNRIERARFRDPRAARMMFAELVRDHYLPTYAHPAGTPSLWHGLRMAGWQLPGVPRVPGLTELLAQLQAQTEALRQLPLTVADLSRAVVDLTDVLSATRETIASAQRVSERLERAVAELDEPVRALRPGLEKVARVLEDPAIDQVPETLRRLQDSVVPLVEGLRHSQARFESVVARLSRRRTKRRGAPDRDTSGPAHG